MELTMRQQRLAELELHAKRRRGILTTALLVNGTSLVATLFIGSPAPSALAAKIALFALLVCATISALVAFGATLGGAFVGEDDEDVCRQHATFASVSGICVGVAFPILGSLPIDVSWWWGIATVSLEVVALVLVFEGLRYVKADLKQASGH